MAIEQTVLTSGRRIAKLFIKDIEQVSLRELFKGLKTLRPLEKDLFIPQAETLRENILVCDTTLGTKPGLGLLKRLWVTGRVALSKLWLKVRGEKGLEQAFANVEKVSLPQQGTIQDLLTALKNKTHEGKLEPKIPLLSDKTKVPTSPVTTSPPQKTVQPVPTQPPLAGTAKTQALEATNQQAAVVPKETLEKLPALYHPNSAKQAGTAQHETGHMLLAYLMERPIQGIELRAEQAAKLTSDAIKAGVILDTTVVRTRQDLIKELLISLGGKENVDHHFKNAVPWEQEPYKGIYTSLYYGAHHDFHRVQNLLKDGMQKGLLTSSEVAALKDLRLAHLKLDYPDLRVLSPDETLKVGENMEAFLKHPLVRTIQVTAASTFANIPPDMMNALTETLIHKQVVTGNPQVRQLIEKNLDPRLLKALKEQFIQPMVTESGPTYQELLKLS